MTTSGEVGAYLWPGLGVSALVFAYLAYRGWDRTSGIEDFAIAGERLGPYVLGAAYSATMMSAGIFVGYVGWSYAFGLTNLWIFLALTVASPIGLVIFARRVREANVQQGSLSLPDWLGDYYDSELMRVGSAIVALFLIFYIAGQFVAGAFVFETLLGMEYGTALGLLTVVVTLYVLVGGTFTDVYTDAVQAVVMAALGVVVFVSGFWVIDGGVVGTFTQVSETLASQDSSLVATADDSPFYAGGLAIGSLLLVEFAFVAQPQMFNKVLAIDDPRNLRKMIGTYVVCTVLMMLILFGGFYMRALDPTLGTADQAIYVYAEGYLPPVLTAFAGVVILSAVLSTTDGVYIVISTALANDIFRKFLVEEGYVTMDSERADRLSHRLAQVAVVGVGAAGFLLARQPPAYMVELMWIGLAGVVAATAAPILFGVYVPWFVTRRGAVASLFVGIGSYVAVVQAFSVESVFVEGAVGVLLSTASITVVSALGNDAAIGTVEATGAGGEDR